MDSSRKKQLAWVLLGLSLILFIVGSLFAKAARSDLRALSGRRVLAGSVSSDMVRLSSYETSEASLKRLGSKVLLPRMPMAMPTPSRKNEEHFESETGWVTYRHSFEWDSLSSKIALEALAVLRNSRDGWRISDVSMKALEDGSGVSLALVLETARFSESSN